MRSRQEGCGSEASQSLKALQLYLLQRQIQNHLLDQMFLFCTQISSASLASTGAVASVACLMVRLVVHVEELTGQGSIKSIRKVSLLGLSPL
jgi:hypothetical protein